MASEKYGNYCFSISNNILHSREDAEECVNDALLRTESRHTRRRIRSRMSLIAAFLALVLCLFGISFLFNRNSSKDNDFSWFVIAAYAADADLEELGLNDGHFSSGGTGEPLFGEDTPLFRFTVKPANWEDNQAAYSRFVVTVSRDGKILDSLDDHVLVMHKAPVSGSAASYECE